MIKLLNKFNTWLGNFLWNVESNKRKVRIVKFKKVIKKSSKFSRWLNVYLKLCMVAYY
jgi:hypothetical protein